ncbi:Ran-interacting Mog1 protein, partial [Opisthorchis viverrini]
MQDRYLFDGAFTLVLPSYAIDARYSLICVDFAMHTTSGAVLSIFGVTIDSQKEDWLFDVSNHIIPLFPNIFTELILDFDYIGLPCVFDCSAFITLTCSDGAFCFETACFIHPYSDLRQIPDNQEVFVHPSTNQSVVVDILEQIDTQDPKEAARLHFQEVGRTNDASEVVIETVEELSPPYRDPQTTVVVVPPRVFYLTISCTSMVYLTGLQKVAKFNETVEHLVRIYQALYRYSSDSADVLVSVNNPLEDDLVSLSSPNRIPACFPSSYPLCELNGTASGDSVPSAPWDDQLIRTIACSLQLR